VTRTRAAIQRLNCVIERCEAGGCEPCDRAGTSSGEDAAGQAGLDRLIANLRAHKLCFALRVLEGWHRGSRGPGRGWAGGISVWDALLERNGIL
jgi:hypothetical protein